MDKTGVGDWFLLYLLGQNIDHIVFKERDNILIKTGSVHFYSTVQNRYQGISNRNTTNIYSF